MNRFISNGNIFTNIIKIGLTFWIKKQCNNIEELEIGIKGIRIGSINSQISSINLRACNIDFKGILINDLTLEASDLIFEFDINQSINNMVSINKDFKIKASIRSNQDKIYSTITSEDWLYLNKWFEENLLKEGSISSIKMEEEKLTIKILNENNNNFMQKDFFIEARDGNLYFIETETFSEYLLPIEDSIYIEKAYISEGLISIDLTSNVNN